MSKKNKKNMTNRIGIPVDSKFPEGTKFFGGCGGGQEEPSDYYPKQFNVSPYRFHNRVLSGGGTRIFTDNKYTKNIGGVINNFADIAVAANNELAFKIKRADAEDKMDGFTIPEEHYPKTLLARTINEEGDGVKNVFIGCKSEVPICYGISRGPAPKIADAPSLISLNGEDLHGMFIPFSCDPRYYDAIIKYVETLKSKLEVCSATNILKDVHRKPSFEDNVKVVSYSESQAAKSTQELPRYPMPYSADAFATPVCPADEDTDENK